MNELTTYEIIICGAALVVAAVLIFGSKEK